VVTAWSVEGSDDVRFITLGLIEGQPLDRLISGNGLLADRIIEIAGTIAEGARRSSRRGNCAQRRRRMGWCRKQVQSFRVEFGLAKAPRLQSLGGLHPEGK